MIDGLAGSGSGLDYLTVLALEVAVHDIGVQVRHRIRHVHQDLQQLRHKWRKLFVTVTPASCRAGWK